LDTLPWSESLTLNPTTRPRHLNNEATGPDLS
jgi:hypothetical protein